MKPPRELPRLKMPRIGSPRLGPPRLLPIVIFASLALLGFKSIGLLTGTGYVLDGTAVARAAEGGEGAGPSVADAAPRTEPTANDTAPTIADTTPTLALPPDPNKHAAGEGGGEAGGEAATPEGAAEGSDIAKASQPQPRPDPQPSNSTAAAVTTTVAAATPPANPAQANTAQAKPGVPVCPPGTPTEAPAGESAGPAAPADPSLLIAGKNCDAAIIHVNDAGDEVPLVGPDGIAPNATEQTILARLGQRRSDLDKRENALQLREATVEAAEKQLDARTDALKALEAKLQALDDQRKAANDEQLTALVKMYETMKPQEAAPIFDGLDMQVLIRVAKAMDPRKMSAVLAKMSSVRAEALTTALAQPVPGILEPQAGDATAAIDPNALPQIVGH